MNLSSAGKVRSRWPSLSGLLQVVERVFAALVNPARQNYAILGVLASYVVIWTLYGVVSKSSGDIHPDTGELLNWSNELALGYWKHPPFGVYVVKTWTTIFPIDDWSFYLLGMINAAIALWIAWRMSSPFLSEEKRIVGVALLTLVPFFNLLSLNYNHNTLLMPLWAMTTLFFLKSFKTRHLGFAALAGLAGGVAILGKYWTLSLIAGLMLAALLDPRRRSYFSSAAPWVTVLVGSIIIAPNMLWLYQNHFISLTYAKDSYAGTSFVLDVASALKYFVELILYAIIPIAVVALVARRSRAVIYDTLFPSTPDRRLIAIIFWTPLLLPIPIAIFDNVRVNSLWEIPALILLPVVLLGSPRLNFTTETSTRITAAALVFPLVALLFAPLVALNAFWNIENSRPYSRLLSAAAQGIWRGETDKPLKLVVGDPTPAMGIAFYSPDHPIVNPRDSMSDRWAGKIPPIDTDSEKIRRSGAIAVCVGTAWECAPFLRELLPTASLGQLQEVMLTRRFLSWSGKPAAFTIVAIPPTS
jgi:Dolichyl-phosphate-mannose-protein mannosyltransferase